MLDMLAAVREARPDWTLAMIAASNGPLVSKGRRIRRCRRQCPSRTRSPGSANGGRADRSSPASVSARGLLAASAPALSYARRLRRRLLDSPPRHHSQQRFENASSRRARAAVRREARVAPARLSGGAACDGAAADEPGATMRRAARELGQRRCAGARTFRRACSGAHDLQLSGSRALQSGRAACGSRRACRACRRLLPAESASGLWRRSRGGKGTAVFLEALARLRDSAARARLYRRRCRSIDTDASQHSRERAAGAGGGARAGRSVGFTGKVDDVSAVLRALDIAVHASTEPEPFGLVIAEAMACGRPIVVSRAGGAAEIAQRRSGVSRARQQRRPCRPRLTRSWRADAARARGARCRRARAALALFNRGTLSRRAIPVTNRLRVLHVHSGNLYGGVETFLLSLARFRALAPSMDMSVALTSDGRIAAELRGAGVPVTILGDARMSRPLSVRRARRALAALLRSDRPDVIVCHQPWPLALFGPVAKRHSVPLVLWMHMAASRHWLDRLAWRVRPGTIVCNSRFTASTLPRSSARVEVVYAPVETIAPCGSRRRIQRPCRHHSGQQDGAAERARRAARRARAVARSMRDGRAGSPVERSVAHEAQYMAVASLTSSGAGHRRSRRISRRSLRRPARFSPALISTASRTSSPTRSASAWSKRWRPAFRL